jgi:CRISPR-associated RAMP protein (TIGR02581 family)
VRAGRQAHDPLRPDTSVVRTRTRQGDTVYLPGAGLKGVFRSHAERILVASGKTVCDPFLQTTDCRKHRSDAKAEQVLRASCPACRTFGSTAVAGRLRLADAYPVEAEWETTNATEIRNGVGIDRVTQSAARGVLYDFEAVTAGRFRARVDLENFTLWQLALTLQVLVDLEGGVLQIGGLKSRGAGSVRIEDTVLDYAHASRNDRLEGVGSLMPAVDAEARGIEIEQPVKPEGVAFTPHGILRGTRIAGLAGLESLLGYLGTTAWSAFAAGGRHG